MGATVRSYGTSSLKPLRRMQIENSERAGKYRPSLVQSQVPVSRVTGNLIPST
jgi:hypothetical protein